MDTLYAPPEPAHPTSSTPDGVLVFLKRDAGIGWDIVTLDPSQKKLQPHLTGSADEHSPVFSPDGRWLAYVSNETGQNEVYVRSFPMMGGAVQVSARGGRQPRWSPTGDEVFYRGEEGMIAATVSTSPSFRVRGRKVLFDDKPYLTHQYGSSTYDVHPDGERFLMIRLGSEARRVQVVLNWFTQPKRNGTQSALTLQPNGLAQ
jgi:dipeptidyl aminopeptidase/acylaminoacyl peptidase